MGFKFVAEIFNGRQHRIGRGLTESAQTLRPDRLRELFQLFDIARPAFAIAKPRQNFKHPLGADAAGRAFAARFALRERQKIACHFDHAVAVVQHYESAGTHHRSDFFQRFKVDRGIAERRRNTSAGRSTDLHRLECPAVGNAAADLINHFVNSYTHRHFNQPAALDFTRQRKHLGAFTVFRSKPGERFRAIANDPRHDRIRFRIIHQRRAPVQPLLRRKRRAVTRHAAPSFERSNQR